MVMNSKLQISGIQKESQGSEITLDKILRESPATTEGPKRAGHHAQAAARLVPGSLGTSVQTVAKG